MLHLSITTEQAKTWKCVGRGRSGTEVFYKGWGRAPLERHFALCMGARWRVTKRLSRQFKVLGLQTAFFLSSFQPTVPILYFHTGAAAQLGSALPLLSAHHSFPSFLPRSLSPGCFSFLWCSPLATETWEYQSYRTSSTDFAACVQTVVAGGCKWRWKEIPDY